MQEKIICGQKAAVRNEAENHSQHAEDTKILST